jgi:peptidoglycan/LPS O-acetylase OafA/YrhL
MTPLFISLSVTVPLIALVTWLYLRFRRYTLPPQMRYGFAWAMLAFVAAMGPTCFAFMYFDQEPRPRRFITLAVVWILGLGGLVADLRRLRKERRTHDDAA